MRLKTLTTSHRIALKRSSKMRLKSMRAADVQHAELIKAEVEAEVKEEVALMQEAHPTPDPQHLA